ncbi:Follistatin, partial [Armadillidium nasatum]
MKNGLPKCVCSPKCYLQHKSSVCGTDGRTYSSECQLLKRSCRKKKQLYVKHSGPCQTCRGVKCKRKRTCILDELLKPRCLKCPKSCKSKPMKKKRLICGTDGITYESKCHIKMASCQAGHTPNIQLPPISCAVNS